MKEGAERQDIGAGGQLALGSGWWCEPVAEELQKMETVPLVTEDLAAFVPASRDV